MCDLDRALLDRFNCNDRDDRDDRDILGILDDRRLLGDRNNRCNLEGCSEEQLLDELAERLEREERRRCLRRCIRRCFRCCRSI